MTPAAVARAAQVIDAAIDREYEMSGINFSSQHRIAQALADAGLLAVDWDELLAEYGYTPMTGEEIAVATKYARTHFRLQRTVIEAAKAWWREAEGCHVSATVEGELSDAVDALLEAEAEL